jgi:hypothetical protein
MTRDALGYSKPAILGSDPTGGMAEILVLLFVIGSILYERSII